MFASYQCKFQGYDVDWDDNKSLKRDTRLVYYCVPVPGRNCWTRPDSLNDVTKAALDVTNTSRDVTTPNNVVEMSAGKKRGAEDADKMDTRDDDAKKIRSDDIADETAQEKDSSPFQGTMLFMLIFLLSVYHVLQ